MEENPQKHSWLKFWKPEDGHPLLSTSSPREYGSWSLRKHWRKWIRYILAGMAQSWFCWCVVMPAGHGSNSTAATDATIAATQMLLAACNAGVDSVWAGVHEPEKTREVFGLPETMIPICFIDLGFRPEGFKGNRDHGKRNPVEAMVTRL